MKRSSLLITIWGILYLGCTGLGFAPEPEGAARAVLTLLSALFFVPPFLLLKEGRRYVRLIRLLAALSLSTTVIFLCASILSALRSETLGSILHVLLGICSAPMLSSGYWIGSLFLWACLLFAAIAKGKETA